MLETFKKNKEEIIAVFIFLFFAFGFNVYRVQGDGVLYYSFLEKMLGVARPEMPADTVKGAFFYQGGCALFNAPFYLSAYFFENLLPHKYNFNGITFRQISINLASNFYIALALITAIKILKKLNFKYRIFPVVSILFSTAAFSAGVIIPACNHAVDIFINTLGVYLLLISLEDRPVKSIWLGILCLIAIFVRYTNFLLLIAVAAYYLLNKKYRHACFLFIGFAGVAWLLPLFLLTYNGTISPLYNTNITADTIKHSAMLPAFPKYTLKLLVHPLHGLFVWSPVTILSALGLFFMPGKKERLGYFLFITWVFFLFLHGFLFFWNGGWSFSNRYLVPLFPVFVIGLSAFLEKHGRKAYALAVIFTLYSGFLFINWLLCIMHGEFGTIGNMLEAWRSGHSGTALQQKVNWKTFFYRIIEVCRYKHLFLGIK